MKTYETELWVGPSTEAPITVHYSEDQYGVSIDHITASVYVPSLGKFVEGDITPFVDENAYQGLIDEVANLEARNENAT